MSFFHSLLSLKGNNNNTNIISRINTFKEVSINPIYQVVDNVHRVFIPINFEFAAFYDFEKESSSEDQYIALARGWGIMPYYELKMPETNSGTFVNYGSSLSSYASIIGATISGNFIGTGLKFRSSIDNRGGIWEFVIDEDITVIISTYNSSSVSRAIQTIIDSLPFGEHSYIGTFLGDDPENVPSGGAGTSRGWIATNATTDPSVIGVYDKPILIIGSPNPNFCDDTNVTNYISRTYLATNGSHKDFAMQLKDSLFGGLGDWIPNHNTIGTATIFENLATDRSLKIDSGSNLFEVSNRYTLGVSGTIIEIYQKFQGVNTNDDENPIIEAELTFTWSIKGLSIHGNISSLKEVTTGSSYLSMFDNLKSAFSTVLYNNTELDIPGGTTSGTLIDKEGLLSWDGGLIAVNKSGSDFQKALVQGFLLHSVIDSMNYPENLGQKLHYETNSTRIKIYPTVASAGNYNTSFNWSIDVTMGIVPDAYNELKPIT